MANAGYIPIDQLLTLRKFGTRLQGHPERVRLPSLETTSGRLGEGLAQGAGMALEAKFKLNNLTCEVDRNFIQIDGSTEDVMPLEPFADKYRAFHWAVFECDDNDITELIAYYGMEAKAIKQAVVRVRDRKRA